MTIRSMPTRISDENWERTFPKSRPAPSTRSECQDAEPACVGCDPECELSDVCHHSSCNLDADGHPTLATPVDDENTRIHPTSGRLLSASPVVTRPHDYVGGRCSRCGGEVTNGETRGRNCPGAELLPEYRARWCEPGTTLGHPEPNRCTACGKPCAFQDHDHRCSSCVEAGWAPMRTNAKPEPVGDGAERFAVTPEMWIEELSKRVGADTYDVTDEDRAEMATWICDIQNAAINEDRKSPNRPDARAEKAEADADSLRKALTDETHNANAYAHERDAALARVKELEAAASQALFCLGEDPAEVNTFDVVKGAGILRAVLAAAPGTGGAK